MQNPPKTTNDSHTYKLRYEYGYDLKLTIFSFSHNFSFIWDKEKSITTFVCQLRADNNNFIIIITMARETTPILLITIILSAQCVDCTSDAIRVTASFNQVPFTVQILSLEHGSHIKRNWLSLHFIVTCFRINKMNQF